MAIQQRNGRFVYPLVGEVIVHTEKGSERFDIRFGRHVASSRVARCPLDEQGRPVDDVWICWADDRGYGNIRCLWATRMRFDAPRRISSIRVRCTQAGAAAGWVVGAIAIGR